MIDFRNDQVRVVSLFVSFLAAFAGATEAQSSKFEKGWKFIGLEYANQVKVDSFRKLGVNWNDQFIIEKTNLADTMESAGVRSMKRELELLKGHHWMSVELPHTAFPEPLVIVKPREGIAYYLKDFKIAASQKGKRIQIEFEGVMQVSDVWVNDQYMGHFTGGYLPFEVDITDVAHYGSNNKILVKVNNRANPVVPPGKPVGKLDFIYYSGIYRDVWFHVRNALHITNAISANKVAGGGIFVTFPEVEKTKAVVEVQTHVRNEQGRTEDFTIEQELWDRNGNKVASAITLVNKLGADEDAPYIQRLEVREPSLWHPAHPYLYDLRTTLRSHGQVVDENDTRIGIRSFSITGKEGLLINGEPYRLVGTNRHQSYPYIGNALSNEANYRDAWLIKAAGMNAVRTSHYPPDPSFLEAADELGLLIIDCIPGWQYFNSNTAFTDHVMEDIRKTIRRDRNHASVLLWEVSLNETYPSAEFRCQQAAVARSEWKGSLNFFTSGDSYFTKACWDVPYDDWNGDPGARDNTTYPDNAFLIREYGDYEFGGGSSTTRQLRSAGEAGLLQQAWNLQWSHNKNGKLFPRALGDLTWAFFDGFAGLVTGIEGWGVADAFRIPKYSYFFYKSQQPVQLNPSLPFASGPVVFIASNWTGQSDPSKLVVYSNCEEVALYLNGELIRRQAPDSGPESDYGAADSNEGHYFDGGNANRLLHPPFTFHVSGFTSGTLKAVGLIAGKPAKEYTVATPGKLSFLTVDIATNGKPFMAGGDEVFVYARLSDAQSQLLGDCQLPVTLEVSGDATLQSPATVNAEAGVASFILKSGKSRGFVSIKAVTKGLQSKPVLVTVH